MKVKYCQTCSKELISREIDNRNRLCCPDDACGYVFWNNPTPVVMAIVELPDGVVLAHNKAWPPGIYSVISGFLEAGETPESAVKREVMEELGLNCTDSSFLGAYSFPKMNQLLLVYHIIAHGNIQLNEELDDYKVVPKEKLIGWNSTTDFAIEEWLKSNKVIA